MSSIVTVTKTAAMSMIRTSERNEIAIWISAMGRFIRMDSKKFLRSMQESDCNKYTMDFDFRIYWISPEE